MSIKINLRNLILSSVATSALLYPAVSSAQDSAEQSPPPATPAELAPATTALGTPAEPAPATTAPTAPSVDIIVTATRRSESTQRVPIAIGVVTGTEIQNSGVASLLQIESIAPGVQFAKGPTTTGAGVTIRGIGSASGVPSFDNSVGLFLDGFYASRSREFSSSLFDVQRIEVVRGTQAALLGKNTSLGAINIITRKPGKDLAIDLRAAREFELGSTLISGGIDVPLSETLAVRVAGQYNNDEAFVENLIGRDGLRTHDRAIRGVALWRPLDNLSVTAVAQHSDTRLTGSPIEFVRLNANVIALQALAGFPGTLDANLDRHNAMLVDPDGEVSRERLRVNRYTLSADWTLGFGTLTSATSYSNYQDKNLADFDFTAGRYNTRDENEDSRQFTQEIRLVSNSNQPFQYVVGGLYVDNTMELKQTMNANYPTVVGSFQTRYTQKTKTYSGFAQGTYTIADKLRLLGGVRFTNEPKRGDFERIILRPGNYINAFPGYAPFTRKRSENNFDYSGGIQYDVARDVMAYASYGKGTKGGGYAPTVSLLDRSEYLKEIARTVEVGLKTQNRSAGWLLNIAAFHTLVDGFQVVTFTGTFQVNNADLYTNGVEVEGSWRLTPYLRLFGNGTYAKARDRKTKNRIPLAPDWQGSVGYDLDLPIGSKLKALSNGSIDYRSSRTSQQNPLATPISDPFTTFNLSAGVGSADDRWDVRLIGRNLTNANSINFAFPTPTVGPGAVNAISERPRTIALQLSTHF